MPHKDKEKRREYAKQWQEANRGKNREKDNEKARRYRKANPEKIREARHRWWAANSERLKAWNQEKIRCWKLANPEKAREGYKAYARRNPEKILASRRKRDGIDPIAAVTLLQAAIECAICGRSDKRLLPDHDHTTGQLRGALCGACNLGLGKFADSQELLIKAANYLKLHYTHKETA